LVKNFVKRALQEDVGRGDLFRLVSKKRRVQAQIKAKEDGILAGIEYAKALCKIEKIEFEFFKKDGDEIKSGDTIVTLKGKSNKILMCERTLLNLSLLCDKRLPLIPQEESISLYIDGILEYYEDAKTDKLKEFFIKNYEILHSNIKGAS